MSEAALETLRSAGANIDAMTPAQREVFGALSPEDLAVVTALQTRLNEVEEEVIGQAMDNKNNNVC